jgi:hypothetical protein
MALFRQPPDQIPADKSGAANDCYLAHFNINSLPRIIAVLYQLLPCQQQPYRTGMKGRVSNVPHSATKT